MKKISFILTVAIISIISLVGCKRDAIYYVESENHKTLTKAMRTLWSDHVSWTRNVIINIIDGAPGTTEAVNRLMKNQEDIGNAMKPYYGEAGGNGLTALLKSHISTAADLLIAAKNGNTASYNMAYANWYANGDSIAVFLNSANPNHWLLPDWKAMMKEHLDYTLEEAVARLNGDYIGDVAAYDKAYAELMTMADMLTEGIVLQFPAKF